MKKSLYSSGTILNSITNIYDLHNEYMLFSLNSGFNLFEINDVYFIYIFKCHSVERTTSIKKNFWYWMSLLYYIVIIILVYITRRDSESIRVFINCKKKYNVKLTELLSKQQLICV